MMRANQFREIMRDAGVANAIDPIVREHRLGVEETTALVTEVWRCQTQNVAPIAISSSWAIAALESWKE